MQFKGTPTIAKGQIFRDVSRVGGTLNALTSHDWTAYFETLPADHVDLALSIESDRMANSLFDPEEVESERTVILSERQGSENSPGYALYEEVVGTALQAHPYRHMVIGTETDLRGLTRDDLYSHYRQHYHPGNAFIVAVGSFQADSLLQQIERRFGAIPDTAQPSPLVSVVDPPQPGERRVVIRKPAGAPLLRMAFHAPAATDPDAVPLLVTEAILSGGQPMGLGGGSSMGRSSRLYRALVASGLARGAGSDMSLSLDPFLFQIAATGLPDSDLGAIEAVILEEIERLRNEPVTAEELARAIRQLEAQFVYSAEGVTNQAYWLGHWQIVDSWQRAESLPEAIRAVTTEDVQHVANRYLDPAYATTGWLVPTQATGSAANVESGDETAVPHFWGLTGPHPRPGKNRSGFQRAEPGNGMVILGQERPGSRSVTLRARVPAGAVYEAENEAGLAHLTARSMLRGSGGKSFAAINERTDSLGSVISIDSGRFFIDARVRCLVDDLPEMTHLLAQTLLSPDFPESEVEKVRAEQLGAIAEADNDTRATAERTLRRAVYPEPNPLGRRLLGEVEGVRSFTAETARGFHERYMGLDEMTFAIVGGFGAFAGAVEMIAQAFAGGRIRSSPMSPPDLSQTALVASRESTVVPGKSQADLVMGIATIPRGDDAYYSLDIANLILGRLGLMGRLGAEVRDRQGLAYYVYSQIEPRRDGSLWAARAGVDPANVDRAVESIFRELAAIRGDHVSEEELSDAQNFLVGALPLALESHDGVAGTLLAIEEFDLGLDFIDRYPGLILAQTRDSVLAAGALLDPERMVVRIAGPA
jgi:zinc protease